MPTSTSILIVDDHPIVRRGLASFLAAQEDLIIVGEAATGIEALELAVQHAPDVILLDLILPGIDGIETSRRLKEQSPNSRVILLTSSEDEDHILDGMRAGACAYVLKSVSPETLLETIRKVAIGEVALDSRVAALLVRSLQRPTPDPQTPPANLSERELEVLRLVAQGLTNAEIGKRVFLSDKTIKSHVSNILMKLHLADRTQAAIYAWKQGLLE